MPVTPYFENLMLQYAVRGQTFVVSSWWAGLAASTNGSFELVDLGRVLVTWDDSFVNENELAWLEASEATSVRSVTFWDAQSGGNRLAHGVTPTTLFLSLGSVVLAEPGAVQLEMPAS